MITEEKKFVAEVSECSDIIKMGIDTDSQADMESILEILGDSMYSNKPLTLIREYSTNAYDAHVEAGIGDKPIEIFLPSPFIPELKIRDYGKGLDRDGMQNYAFYGKSSKRNSNDVVGHLGVGCKSAFAYTDTFTIVSIHEGVKSLYSATKDATGYKIFCLNSEPSDEPSGIEISIFVNPKDVSSFIDNAFTFFKHFNPRPVFINHNYMNNWIEGYHETKLMDAGKWIVYNQKPTQSSVSVVMGNIIYPVNLENIQLDTNVTNFLDYWRSKSIVLFANIGEISHASTRENLKYDNKTKEWLVDVISRIPQEASELSHKFVSECNSLWQARILYNNLLSSMLGNHLLDIEYNGHKLPKMNSSLSIYRPSKSIKYNRYNSRWESASSIHANEDTVVFYAKGDITYTSVMERLQNYIKANSYKLSEHSTHIVFFKNPENAQKFIDAVEFQGCEMVDLATCHYFKPRRTKNSVDVPVGSIFECKSDNYYNAVNSDYWKVADNIPDNEIKYYVTISHYKPVYSTLSLGELTNLAKDIKILSKTDSKLYGVKKSEVAKLDDSWVEINTLFKSLFAEMCQNQHFMDYMTHCILNYNTEYRFMLDLRVYSNMIPDEHPAKEFIKGITPYLRDSYEYNILRKYATFADVKDDALYAKQKGFLDEFFTKYPMLKHVTVDKTSLQDILEYTKSG